MTDPTFADILARARELHPMTDTEWDASLAAPGVNGRALDALGKATWLLANGLTSLDQRVEDVAKADLLAERLWNRTVADREAAYRDALGRVYGK